MGTAMFVAAVQRVLLQLVAVLEQIGTELPARARQVMQSIEVELAGQLSNNTVSLLWLAYIRARSQVVAQRFRLTDNSSGRR